MRANGRQGRRTTGDEHDEEHQQDDADDDVGSNDSIDVVGIRNTRNMNSSGSGDAALLHGAGDGLADRTGAILGTFGIVGTPSTQTTHANRSRNTICALLSCIAGGASGSGEGANWRSIWAGRGGVASLARATDEIARERVTRKGPAIGLGGAWAAGGACTNGSGGCARWRTL